MAILNPLAMLFPPFFAIGAANLVLGLRRAIRGVGFGRMRELTGMPVTLIAEARTGRMKFCGKARGAGHVQSLVNALPCIAHRRVTWVRTSRNTVTVDGEETSFPFVLDDGSGEKITIDPKSADLDYEPLARTESGGASEEQVLKDGDTLVVIGDVEVASATPYREGGVDRIRFVGRPFVSWRSDPDLLPKLRPGVLPSFLALVGGIGMIWAFRSDLGEFGLPMLLGETGICMMYAGIHGFLTR